MAEVVAALWAEEIEKIRRDQAIEKKGAAIDSALERLAGEALVLLPRCEVEILTPQKTTYAYVSAPEATAYRAKNPDCQIRPYTYTPPPEPEERRKKPLYDQDLKRIEDKIRKLIEGQLDEIAERNSYAEGRLFAKRLETKIPKWLASWVKVEGAQEKRETEELIHVCDLSGVPHSDGAAGPVENLSTVEDLTPDSLSGGHSDNSAKFNDLEKPIFASLEIEPVETSPDPVPELTGSVNFDSSLEAALFYVKDGWAVVPCCQFEEATGRCTGPESHHKDGDCKGKRPLIAGPKDKDGKPKAEGYQAASRDKGLIRDWFTRKYPDAGVALRLDRATPEGQEYDILLDYDVKDGARGLETRRTLHDTFDLPETLTSISQSRGIHEVYALPPDLPADYLKSWTRVLDDAELGGLDIKVGVKGLAHVEPTRGPKGVYRWVDPTAPIAELPRAVCDYLHDVYKRRERAQQQRAAESAENAGPFDPNEDQSRYFKDVPAGERRPWLLKCARKLRARGAGAEDIVRVLRSYAGRFSAGPPPDVESWIARVARECVEKFASEVAAQ